MKLQEKEYKGLRVEELPVATGYELKELLGKQELDDFDLIAKDLEVVSSTSYQQDQDKYKQYIAENPVPVSSPALEW